MDLDIRMGINSFYKNEYEIAKSVSTLFVTITLNLIKNIETYQLMNLFIRLGLGDNFYLHPTQLSTLLIICIV